MKNTEGLVAIAAALPIELSGIRSLGGFKKEKAGGIEFMVGDVRGAGVALLVSGVGADRAYKTAKAACGSLPIRAYVSAGFSGALREDLRAGDVVVGTRTTPVETGVAYSSTPELVETFRERLQGVPGVRFGSLLTITRVVVESSEKKRYSVGGAGLALDMESSGAAGAAYEADVPFIAVRAISDTIEEDIPIDFNLFIDEDGGLKRMRLAAHVLKNPGALSPLMRLAQNSRLAAKSLAMVVERVLAA